MSFSCNEAEEELTSTGRSNGSSIDGGRQSEDKEDKE
jgi:hypothetical protein